MNSKKLVMVALVLLCTTFLSPLANLVAVTPTRALQATEQPTSVSYLPLLAFNVAPPTSTATTTPAPSDTPTNTPTATTTPAPSDTPTNTPTATTPPQNGAIVADHLVIGQFAQIPQNAIAAAAAQNTLFLHQSVGEYIGEGLSCLAGLFYAPEECATYLNNRLSGGWPWYDKSNWSWDMWPEPMSNAIAKTDQFVSVVHSRAGSYQVIGMKYCYVDGWNQGENVAQSYYIKKMLALESEYPGKTFIWATSALWAVPDGACDPGREHCRQIAEFNQQVRAYARAHNKPLYDIADIESHDRNGNPCTVQGYEGMCADWYLNGGGHPNFEGSMRLAKGFWWLMARISGWSGN